MGWGGEGLRREEVWVYKESLFMRVKVSEECIYMCLCVCLKGGDGNELRAI